MQNDKKLVIMYMEGQNYDFSGIKVTIKSLKEYYNGDITVIVKNVDNRLTSFLREYDVNIVSASDYNVIFNTSPYNNKIIYIHLYFQKYKEVLKDHQILYCDMNDVYFKTDPFSLKYDYLWFGLEDLEIGKCETNSIWCSVCYGNDILNLIKDNIVINSGIIIGSFSKMEDLYTRMINDMSKILYRINYPITDQIIVNKVVYLDKLLCTLDSTNVNNLAQGIKTNIDNLINHQYKVNKEFKNLLYKKYE